MARKYYNQADRFDQRGRNLRSVHAKLPEMDLIDCENPYVRMLLGEEEQADPLSLRGSREIGFCGWIRP